MKAPEEITLWCDMMLNHHPNIEDTNFFNSIKDYMKKQRPHGEWSDESKDSLLCSVCGKRVYKPFIGGFPTERTSQYYPNFCAFCGADMRKEEAE